MTNTIGCFKRYRTKTTCWQSTSKMQWLRVWSSRKWKLTRDYSKGKSTAISTTLSSCSNRSTTPWIQTARLISKSRLTRASNWLKPTTKTQNWERRLTITLRKHLTTTTSTQWLRVYRAAKPFKLAKKRVLSRKASCPPCLTLSSCLGQPQKYRVASTLSWSCGEITFLFYLSTKLNRIKSNVREGGTKASYV